MLCYFSKKESSFFVIFFFFLPFTYKNRNTSHNQRIRLIKSMFFLRKKKFSFSSSCRFINETVHLDDQLNKNNVYALQFCISYTRVCVLAEFTKIYTTKNENKKKIRKLKQKICTLWNRFVYALMISVGFWLVLANEIYTMNGVLNAICFLFRVCKKYNIRVIHWLALKIKNDSSIENIFQKIMRHGINKTTSAKIGSINFVVVVVAVVIAIWLIEKIHTFFSWNLHTHTKKT